MIVQPGRSTCVRCEQEFTIGTREPCPKACDGGEHESTTIHFFKPGRFDGLCSEPIGHGLMCGYEHGQVQVHTEIPPEVTILR